MNDFPAWESVRRRAARHPLAAVVQASLAKVPKGACVMVAASGGADSTALAVVTASVARRAGWSVELTTVDHGLRAGSAADADFVEALGAWMGVRVRRAKLRLTAGSAVAARARDARYRALARTASDAKAAVVLLAHHADDQLETVLMRLVRGAGAAAAGGMPSRRRLSDGVALVRPLLERSRAELGGLLQSCGVPWREDPSNADRSRVRGRLRHEVLPVLESLRAGAAVRASRTARRVRGAATSLRRRAAGLLSGDGPWARARLRKAGAQVLAVALRGAEPSAAEATVERRVAAVRDGVARPRRFTLGSCEWTVRAREVTRTPIVRPGVTGGRGSLAVDQ